MKMFGINRYVALALIATTLSLWTWVVYRAVAYGHLKQTVAQQKATIDTANRASKSVAATEQAIAAGQTTVDAELCKRGWMAKCPTKHPLIMQFVDMNAIGQELTPAAPVAVGGSDSHPGGPSAGDGARPSLPPPSQPKRKRGQTKAVASTSPPCGPLK